VIEFFEYEQNNEALRLIQHMDEEYPEDWDGSAIRDELRRQHSEIEQLKADVRKMSSYKNVVDAARYRWLRDFSPMFEHVRKTKENIDAAIDAARGNV
jgi:hypothetical protein